MSHSLTPKFLRTTKYIDIDSTYRDRNAYPNPASFVTRTTSVCDGGAASAGLQARDPVLDAYPVLKFTGNVVAHEGIIQGGSTRAPQLDTNASSKRGYYRGAIFAVLPPRRESARITQYFATPTKTASLEIPLAGATEGVRYAILDPSSPDMIYMPDSRLWFSAYSGLYLYDVTIGESREIVQFDPVTDMFVLTEPFSNRWSVTDSYEVRHSPYVVHSVSPYDLQSIKFNTISFDNFPGTIHEGMYVRIVNDTASPPVDAVACIVNTDRDQGTVTFAPPLETNVDLDSTRVEILAFSRDNSMPLNINSTCAFDLGYYEVELKHLALPNMDMATTQGGRLVHYPFVYVEFGNVSNEPRNILISNNPHSTKATFMCFVTDVQLPITSAFSKLYSPMKQVLLLNPYDSLSLTVRMPNGEPFQVLNEDNFSPKPPNPYLQVSALFSITKVEAG